MSHFPGRLQDIVDLISQLPDENERINFLVDYANKYKEVPASIAEKPYPEKNKVPFCESGVYVWTKKNEGNRLKFYFAVENPQGISSKALSAILDRTLSGETPENITNVPDDLVEKIFGENLSTRKHMGLTGIVQKVKREAKNYLEP